MAEYEITLHGKGEVEAENGFTNTVKLQDVSSHVGDSHSALKAAKEVLSNNISITKEWYSAEPPEHLVGMDRSPIIGHIHTPERIDVVNLDTKEKISGYYGRDPDYHREFREIEANERSKNFLPGTPSHFSPENELRLELLESNKGVALRWEGYDNERLAGAIELRNQAKQEILNDNYSTAEHLDKQARKIEALYGNESNELTNAAKETPIEGERLSLSPEIGTGSAPSNKETTLPSEQYDILQEGLKSQRRPSEELVNKVGDYIAEKTKNLSPSDKAEIQSLPLEDGLQIARGFEVHRTESAVSPNVPGTIDIKGLSGSGEVRTESLSITGSAKDLISDAQEAVGKSSEYGIEKPFIVTITDNLSGDSLSGVVSEREGLVWGRDEPGKYREIAQELDLKKEIAAAAYDQRPSELMEVSKELKAEKEVEVSKPDEKPVVSSPSFF
ncbi:MAG: hypothetical protein ACR2QC_02140 [Gammaproteobacteria bacterium]